MQNRYTKLKAKPRNDFEALKGEQNILKAAYQRQKFGKLALWLFFRAAGALGALKIVDTFVNLSHRRIYRSGSAVTFGGY